MDNLMGHLSCSFCNDTWFRDLDDMQVQAYIDENPELEERILAGEITDIDLGEVLCDGCEDYFQDEAALAEAWDDYPEWEKEDV